LPEADYIVGFDDFAWTANFNPKLTTIVQPTFEMGSRTMKALSQKSTGPAERSARSRQLPEFAIAKRVSDIVGNLQTRSERFRRSVANLHVNIQPRRPLLIVINSPGDLVTWSAGIHALRLPPDARALFVE
jgi:hypothetical protein